MSNETFETIEAELAKWKAKMSALEGEYEAMRGRWQSNQTEIEWKTRRITRIDEQIAAIGKTVVEGDANVESITREDPFRGELSADLWNMRKSRLEEEAAFLTKERNLVGTAIDTVRAETHALAGQLTRLKREIESSHPEGSPTLTHSAGAPARKDFGVRETDTYEAASEGGPHGKAADRGKRRSKSPPRGVGRGGAAKAGK